MFKDEMTPAGQVWCRRHRQSHRAVLARAWLGSHPHEGVGLAQSVPAHRVPEPPTDSALGRVRGGHSVRVSPLLV